MQIGMSIYILLLNKQSFREAEDLAQSYTVRKLLCKDLKMDPSSLPQSA